MKLSQKRVLFVSTVLASLTGLFIFVLKTFFETQGDFGFEAHPWLDEAKMFHYLVTPALVVSFGLLWESHISKGVRNKLRKKQRTGWLILGLMVALVFTGQAMLSIVQNNLHYWVGWVHLGLGVLISASIFWHSRRD
jgi:hypothetical protein